MSNHLPSSSSQVSSSPAEQPNSTEPHDPQLSPPLAEQWQYEETVATIEAIISQIETGELSLADVFSQFEAAVAHLQACESFLNYHQKKVDLLIETLTDEDSTS